MSPLQDESWIDRLGIYWIFAIGALFGLAFVLILTLIVGWNLNPLAALGIICGFGVGVAALSLAWLVFTTKAPDLVRQFPIPVPLSEFLADAEAVIAPNLDPIASERLAEWLMEFRLSHGEDSVWVLPLPDGPTSDSVVLSVADFSPQELVALRRFGADSVEALPAEAQQAILPQIPEGRKLIEVFWDQQFPNLELRDPRWWNAALAGLAKREESTDSLRFVPLPTLHSPPRSPIGSALMIYQHADKRRPGLADKAEQRGAYRAVIIVLACAALRPAR